MHFGFFLTGKKKKRKKEKKKPVGFFPLDLLGHSRSRIVHCAGPHPPRSCVRKLCNYKYWLLSYSLYGVLVLVFVIYNENM